MFHFKKFSIDDTHCAMKVGTDAVLLGAWTAIETQGDILDIGTGSGILALMLAQKTTANSIVALEIDNAAARNAAENIEKTPWAKRIKVVNADLQAFHKNTSQKFAHIISNPPFFQNNLVTKDYRINLAKHSINLTYESLINMASQLLADSGQMSVIIPFDYKAAFIGICALNRLELKHITDVYGKADGLAKRSLLLFVKSPAHQTKPTENSLSIRDSQNNYTPEYKNLVKDYLLAF